ncbi:dynein light chain (Tctex1), putative [Talaromyces stipitatus ATCC 10500]|uniref:Dynein light chain (Tctex1), putative n=1 Tax=Talaromyces stipitatus (strain ATCC 10500 / CBS 375.48 / QM 6759 / NRRL 1006) TaxID=441959 RepID=B8LVG3_TALSN|nr:dynein light chain (Tctex1), putative [Talaromyces stipitatus ATCC 10500]XP_002341370.1 dynein light chain (Tctex1), putative [Talaromyces stipitatus ATCC 10500]EED23982.1 dynein light chain (Tctex1), putative [Talaromyces stipitatus ATCC 10500]EED23983.1 dynein light chain (Tctex1), putative [Talaromyces stipitatus ATCC 10500]
MAVEPTPTSSFPLPPSELSKIATEACDGALSKASGYDHTQVATWNSTIINSVLKALIAATTPEQSSTTTTTTSTPTTTPTTPPYRFTVNSTIVQQGVIDKAAAGSSGEIGKRGMHSASGAYWDVNRDGMWTFKYPGAEERGLDVVVSVTWFAMG